MNKLSRDEEVFNYIKEFIDNEGYAPTVRDICAGCGIKSTATVYTILNRLKEQGVINKTDSKRRAVSLKTNAVTVPLLGTVAAGEPIFATQNYEDFYSIPANFFGNDEMFMLTVKGESMRDIGMLEGDKLVVRRQQTADNGDIVVALVDDSSTVKRFFKRGGKIILHPENSEMDDFIFDDVTILGKVVGLMRNI